MCRLIWSYTVPIWHVVNSDHITQTVIQSETLHASTAVSLAIDQTAWIYRLIINILRSVITLYSNNRLKVKLVLEPHIGRQCSPRGWYSWSVLSDSCKYDNRDLVYCIKEVYVWSWSMVMHIIVHVHVILVRLQHTLTLAMN